MIRLNDAIRIAKDWNSKYDTCQEYEDAYAFYIDDGVARAGGPDNGLILEKSSGERIPFAIYYLTGQYDPKEVGEPIKL